MKNGRLFRRTGISGQLSHAPLVLFDSARALNCMNPKDIICADSGFTRAHGVIVDGHVERMDMGYLKGLGLYHCTNFPAFQDAWND